MEITQRDLDLIIRSNPGNMTICKQIDDRLELVYYTDSVPALSGMTMEEYQARFEKNTFEAIIKNDREMMQAKIAYAVNSLQDVDMSFRVFHKIKHFVWVHVKIRIFGKMNGNPLILGYFWDISSESAAYASLVDDSDRLVYVIDKKTWEIYYANKKATDHWGRRDYTGDTCYHFIRGRQSPCPWCVLPRMKTVRELHVEAGYDPEMKRYFTTDSHEINWCERTCVAHSIADVTENVNKQESLSAANLEMARIIDNIPAGICVYEKINGMVVCTYANSYAANIAGNSRDAMIGETILNIGKRFHPDDRKSGMDIIKDLDTIGSTSGTYRHFNSKTGSYLWIHLEGILVPQPGGNDQVYISLTDATGLKIQEEFNQMRGMLDGISAGITVVGMPDPDHVQLIYANKRLFKMLHYKDFDDKDYAVSSDAAMMASYRQDAFSSVHPDDLEHVQGAYRRGYHKTQFTIRNIRLKGGDGQYYWITAVANLKDDDAGYKEFYVTYWDVEEELRLQDELKKRLEKEKELRQLAMKADQLKTEFLSNVSHDMRTPLNAVLGYTRLVKENFDANKEREYIDKIAIAGETLAMLINDTLDLQKIETGTVKLNPEPIKCEELLNRIITAVQPMVDAKHIEFIVDVSNMVPATVNVDIVRIQEILINILSNAAKFTPDGGRIELISECLGRNDRYIHDKIIIRDTGIGMTKEFLPRAFEPFAQERTERTAAIGGSGLGLSIVKRLVELMGGRIEIQSDLGKGTEFTIWLDFELVDTDLAKQTERPILDASLKDKTILLCEDNEMNREIAVAMLAMKGMLIVTAKNGKEGAELFLASKPGTFDAILMDIRMPIMNGYEATDCIRKGSHPQAKTIPIIAMTADAYEEDVKRSLELGMNGHIAKPLEPQTMFLEIIRCLEKRTQ